MSVHELSSSSGWRSCDVTAGGYWGQLLPAQHNAFSYIRTGEPLPKVTTVVPGAKVTAMVVCEVVTLVCSHYQSLQAS